MSEPAARQSVEFGAVTPPDGTARAHALAAGGADGSVQGPNGPLGLGKLGAAAAWITACQGHFPPRPLAQARIVVFAADHGIADREVSGRPAGTTADVVAQVDDGSHLLSVLADTAGAGLRVVDAGLAGSASAAIDVADALSSDQLDEALRAGMAAADAEVDSGADLLIAANLGVGSTTPAATLVAALTGAEPVAVVGRGSGIDDAGWMRKTAAVRDALRRARPHLAEPLALLRTAGGADLAAIAGFLAQAAVRRTPVLLGGLTVCAAAMVAEELAPGAHEWWLAAGTSTEPAHELALEHLDLEPLLDLGLSGDAESGGLAALPLVAMATRALAAAPS